MFHRWLQTSLLWQTHWAHLYDQKHQIIRSNLVIIEKHCFFFFFFLIRINTLFPRTWNSCYFCRLVQSGLVKCGCTYGQHLLSSCGSYICNIGCYLLLLLLLSFLSYAFMPTLKNYLLYMQKDTKRNLGLLIKFPIVKKKHWVQMYQTRTTIYIRLSIYYQITNSMLHYKNHTLIFYAEKKTPHKTNIWLTQLITPVHIYTHTGATFEGCQSNILVALLVPGVLLCSFTLKNTESDLLCIRLMHFSSTVLLKHHALLRSKAICQP